MLESIPAVKFIFEKLNSGLPKILSYHSLDHTKQVFQASIEIGQAEGLSQKEVKLLAVCAAYHDAGFLVGLDNHEEEGCKLAKENLPDFGYSDEEIKLVCNAIMATKIPQSPKTHFEKVLCDADLFYLASDDHPEWRYRLRQELLSRGIIGDKEQFEELELIFLRNHRFHTEYASLKAEGNKKKIIAEIIRAK